MSDERFGSFGSKASRVARTVVVASAVVAILGLGYRVFFYNQGANQRPSVLPFESVVAKNGEAGTQPQKGALAKSPPPLATPTATPSPHASLVGALADQTDAQKFQEAGWVERKNVERPNEKLLSFAITLEQLDHSDALERQFQTQLQTNSLKDKEQVKAIATLLSRALESEGGASSAHLRAKSINLMIESLSNSVGKQDEASGLAQAELTKLVMRLCLLPSDGRRERVISVLSSLDPSRLESVDFLISVLEKTWPITTGQCVNASELGSALDDIAVSLLAVSALQNDALLGRLSKSNRKKVREKMAKIGSSG